MSQLSLYIDDDTLRELEMRAKMAKLSISKYVVTVLKANMVNNWPNGYWDLFGSISDQSFERQEAPDWSYDSDREIL